MDQAAQRNVEDAASIKAVHDILKAAHFAAEKHAGQRRKGLAAEPISIICWK